MARRALSAAQLAVVQAVRSALLEDGRPLSVGLSGGADSWALAAAVSHLGLPARVVVVDHQLQPGSGELAATVAERAKGLGLDAQVVAVEVLNCGEGLEAAARAARLAALCQPGTTVLLGHTLDDQAEQVLLGLARGSGAASLQGIAPVAARGEATIVRPLLGLRREITARAAADWGIEAWQDPMNGDPRFLRVRVRREVLPMLDEALGPRVREALARTASMLREDNDLLDELAGEALLRCRSPRGLSCEALGGEPPALATRVLRGWLVAAGVREPSRAQVLAVQELVHDWRGQRGVDLPGGLRVGRRRGELVIDPVPAS